MLIVVSGWLKRKAQPLRLELADKGSAVLARADVSENGRNLVQMYLDSTFSFRAHLLLAHLVVPVLALVHASRVISNGGKEPNERRERNPEVHSAIDELTDIHLRVTLANHPVLCTSVLFSMAFYYSLAYLVIAVIGGVIPSRVPAAEIAEQVDHAYARISRSRRGFSRPAHGCA